MTTLTMPKQPGRTVGPAPKAPLRRRQPTPMDPERRVAAYRRQTGRVPGRPRITFWVGPRQYGWPDDGLTPAQRKRARKKLKVGAFGGRPTPVRIS